jgi:lipopolysaccharide export system permease protein
MLKVLDRYIIKRFLGTFFFILVAIMLIAVVFDLSEKTQDFTRMTATRREIIVDYYLNFIIYYANLFSGLLIFIAVLLFTSRLAHRSEIIAMLGGGVPFPRILWPYFLAATFLATASLLTNHLVLPKANRVRQTFEERHVRSAFRITDRHIHREIAPGTIAYLESFNTGDNTGFRFGLEQWEGGALVRKLHAERAVYDSTTGIWRLHDWSERLLGEPYDRLVHGTVKDTLIPLRPSDLGARLEFAQAMTWDELNAFIAAKQRQGDARVAPYLIEKHQRTSYPFATYVFTLIGVGIASRKVRGGTGLHLALGLGLVLLYIFAMKLTTVAATNAGMDALLAVWLPNLAFGLVGLWIYRNAPK